MAPKAYRVVGEELLHLALWNLGEARQERRPRNSLEGPRITGTGTY